MDDRSRWFNLNNPYSYRNDNLRVLGFDTYQGYLKSELWQRIRAEVLARAGNVCERCKQRPAVQVHHRAYDPATLKGESLNSLTATCKRCHRKAERPNKMQHRYDRLQRANYAITKRQRVPLSKAIGN